MRGRKRRSFDFGNFEITKREILVSVSIVAIMLLIGVLIAGKISDYQLDKNENHLSPLPQYHIDRDKLCEIVKETVGYDRLMDAFCHGTVVCDEFAWFSNSDEYYIIHLESGMMVNWYKHLGRTNTCSQKDRTIDDYYEFFRLFKEELDYFERRKR